jgi:hypothetical protein
VPQSNRRTDVGARNAALTQFVAARRQYDQPVALMPIYRMLTSC